MAVSPEEVADRIRSYQTAHYDELRTGIARHHVSPDVFPDFLKGANRVVATLG
jgi:hypothetical protein